MKSLEEVNHMIEEWYNSRSFSYKKIAEINQLLTILEEDFTKAINDSTDKLIITEEGSADV